LDFDALDAHRHPIADNRIIFLALMASKVYLYRKPYNIEKVEARRGAVTGETSYRKAELRIGDGICG